MFKKVLSLFKQIKIPGSGKASNSQKQQNPKDAKRNDKAKPENFAKKLSQDEAMKILNFEKNKKITQEQLKDVK